MRILITGGAGFIGSNLVRRMVHAGHQVLNVDKLTYAGKLHSLDDVAGRSNYGLAQVDIVDLEGIREVVAGFRPEGIMHLAAESHVDRSIDGPQQFIQTNVVGTGNLLQATLEYWRGLEGAARESFRFLHVSTDEVYGSLGPEGKFTETTPYDPHSPYSASKAASDHLARAWCDTYGLPVIVTNCSNNYGPYQFPEKLIPVVILKALRGESIPVYGRGENIRDWLYVEDHCEALDVVLHRGRPGQTYNIGGNNELRNTDLVHTLCDLMDELTTKHQEQRTKHSAAQPSTKHQEPRTAQLPSPISPRPLGGRGAGGEGETNLQPGPSISNLQSPASSLITYVKDRPGHDLRYAIDASKIKQELGWEPKQDHQSGFRKTVQWYLDNQPWWENILSGDYRLERQGTIA